MYQHKGVRIGEYGRKARAYTAFGNMLVPKAERNPIFIGVLPGRASEPKKRYPLFLEALGVLDRPDPI